MGEAGTNGAPPAVANAVMDALAPLGIDHIDMPYTAPKLWEAIRQAERESRNEIVNTIGSLDLLYIAQVLIRKVIGGTHAWRSP